MLRALRMGSLFGIKLYLHPTFFLLPIILVISLRAQGAGIATILFHLGLMASVIGCVVLHELGHALMARRYAIPTRDITLYPIGGVARLERMPGGSWEEFWIAVAGPAVNVVIAVLLTPFVFLGLATGALNQELIGLTSFQGIGTAALQFTFFLWFANIVLVVFNMLPTFPMDGGRVLRALLSSRMGLIRATEVAVVVGRALVVCGLGALAIFAPQILLGNPMLIIIGVFVFLMGHLELTGARQRQGAWGNATVSPRVSPVSEPLPVNASEAQTERHPRTGFTGVLWDPNQRIWVLWRDGAPVGIVRL